jgi:hypothetical protein
VEKTFETDAGRRIACEAVSSLCATHPEALLGPAAVSAPYTDLGRPASAHRPSDRSDLVIITGRFRSGSTLLWNLFRQAGGFTAYYEPFNERRWFDPTARGNHTDAAHRQVTDYWREYDGLEVLGEYYREDWVRRHLLMDARFWAPEMVRYVDTLIDRAVGRPVLQCNRIDFRLPWFRRHYPSATYLHIFRHPRDQWCSILDGDAHRFPKDGSISSLPPFDRFYLRTWAEDLKYHFPFLEENRNRHPYQIHYYIWKLSYLFGVKYCDCSIQFEKLVDDTDAEIARLFRAVDADSVDARSLKALVVRPRLGRWRDYADAAWFEAHEAHCEAVLADFLGVKEQAGASTFSPGAASLTAIGAR